jgi:hypothetical protein
MIICLNPTGGAMSGLQFVTPNLWSEVTFSLERGVI